MKAIRFRVRGRVQGVWFRAWTEQTAASLGVTGWVRNLPDGRVEGHAEGEASAIDTLVERLHEGSPASMVDAVDVEVVDHQGHATFTIRR